MLQFLSVSRRFDDGYYGLRDVTFKVDPGQFVFLTGESGAGKSTVLRLVFRTERPSGGTILVDGVDTSAVHGSSLTSLRRSIGMVFQDYMLLFDRTVFDNVALPLAVRGVSKRVMQEEVDTYLERVGMSGYQRRLCQSLSGGEKQRVALARALITKPKVILADEPTGNLDLSNGEKVIEVLRDANLRGATVLMATHDLYLVQSTRLPYVRLRGGRKVEEGNF
ncbi:MAG: ATP-binding cassette domain-containing protein [Caldisericota bacterium]|jgi:cell division transport system ATP-binding protein|nr:ATP-binding cassette domain-containing protein [Caldisericota bacterium]